MTPGITAQELWFAYEPEQWVLRDVTCSIAEGCLTGIVGPNGSGKSTLLRLFCALLHPAKGQVLLNARPVRDLPARERARRLAFLPQMVSPAFTLSAFEVVCLGRYPHTGAMGSLRPGDVETARRCMALTQTEHLRKRAFSELSGGERQRVLLASILAQEPRMLLLDEPTSALDIHHQAEVMSLLRKFSRDGYGVTLVIHDLNLAARFCDRLILLGSEHEVAGAGTPAEVLTPALLSQAYDTSIRVGTHPFSGTPFVMAEETP